MGAVRRKRQLLVASVASTLTIGAITFASRDDVSSQSVATTTSTTAALTTVTATTTATRPATSAGPTVTVPTSAALRWALDFTGGSNGAASGEPVTVGLVANGYSTKQDGSMFVDPGPIASFATYLNEHVGGIAGHPIQVKTCAPDAPGFGATRCADEFGDDPNVVAVFIEEDFWGITAALAGRKALVSPGARGTSGTAFRVPLSLRSPAAWLEAVAQLPPGESYRRIAVMDPGLPSVAEGGTPVPITVVQPTGAMTSATRARRRRFVAPEQRMPSSCSRGRCAKPRTMRRAQLGRAPVLVAAGGQVCPIEGAISVGDNMDPVQAELDNGERFFVEALGARHHPSNHLPTPDSSGTTCSPSGSPASRTSLGHRLLRSRR